jgi:hypothetical protein
METKKNNKGRKPVDDPKKSLRVYIQESIIDKLGGYVAAQVEVVDHLTKKARRIK